MWTNIIVNSLVENRSVVDVVWRRIGIKGKYGVRVFPCVLEKILRKHCRFSQFLASFVEYINQHRLFPELHANITRNLESGTGKRVYRDDFAFVKPKPDSSIELTLDCVLARYLEHSLPMSAMAFVLLAPILPFRFPLLNLRVRNGNDALCQPLETLERRFLFWWWIRSLHAGHYRISSASRQLLPSHRYPDEAESNNTPDNCFFGNSLAPNPVGHSQNVTSRPTYRNANKSHYDQSADEQSNPVNRS